MKNLNSISCKSIQLSAILIMVLMLNIRVVYSDSSIANEQTIKELDEKIQLPNFELNDLDDETRSLSDFKGKVVAVNFWASWCGPCREELQSMEHTYSQYKDDDFVVVAVNVGEDWDTVASFISAYTINFPLLLDPEANVMTEWGAYGLPTTYILNKEGYVTHRIDGGRDWDDKNFRERLESIIKQ